MTSELAGKRRNIWMSHEGRDLYTEWMERVIAASHMFEPDFDLDTVRSQEYVRHRGRAGELNIFSDSIHSVFGRAEDHLLETSTEPLVDRYEEISMYTSLEDFTGPEENAAPRSALYGHNFDSLGFAINSTLGLAHMAERQMAANGQAEMPLYGYESFATRLRNPSFHKTLEDFSFTGFGVHADKAAAMMMAPGGDASLRMYYGLGQTDLLVVDVDHDGQESIRLSEPLAMHLRSKLKDQNIHGIERAKGTDMWESGPISSGCPVRKPVEGKEKSAIALFSEALADRVDKHMVSRNSMASLGHTSLQGISYIDH